MSIPSKEEWVTTYNIALEKKITFSLPTQDDIISIGGKLIEAAEVGRTSMTLEPPAHRMRQTQFQPIVWLEAVRKLLKEKGYNCELMPDLKSAGPEKIQVNFSPL